MVHLVVVDFHLIHDLLQFHLLLEDSVLIGKLEEIVVVRYGLLHVIRPLRDLLRYEIQLRQPDLHKGAQSFQDALGVEDLVERLLIGDS